MARYKNLIITVLFLFFLSMQDAVISRIVFKLSDTFFLSLITILTILFWGALLFLPRLLYLTLLIVQTFLNIVIFSWHQYFKTPMPIELIWKRFDIGLDFAQKSATLFSDPLLWAIIIIGLLNIAAYLLVCRFIRRRYALFFAIPLILFYAFLFNISLVLRPIAFDEDACRHFGYKTCWLHELDGYFKYEAKTDELINSLNKLPAATPIAPTESKHIYVIQVETLLYDIIRHKLPDGREITPFLNKLAADGKIYHINEFKHTASANTDFAVNAGLPIQEGFINYNIYNVFYEQIPPQNIYPHTQTLAQKAEKQGFHTSFYHNYHGNYFNRRPHITAQGYKKVYFYEDMQGQGYRDEIWGYSDYDLADFINKQKKSTSHNAEFTYIITVSSHPDFQLTGNTTPLLRNPQSLTENYYNAINFVDRAIHKLVTDSPQDSIFFIFGDHGSDKLEKETVPFIIYSKNQKLADGKPVQRISSDMMISLIHAQVRAAKIN